MTKEWAMLKSTLIPINTNSTILSWDVSHVLWVHENLLIHCFCKELFHFESKHVRPQNVICLSLSNNVSSFSAWESRTMFDYSCSREWQNALWWLWHVRQPNAHPAVITKYTKYTHRWTNINFNSSNKHTFTFSKQINYTTLTTHDKTNDSRATQSWYGIRVSKPSGQTTVICCCCIVWSKYVLQMLLQLMSLLFAVLGFSNVIIPL